MALATGVAPPWTCKYGCRARLSLSLLPMSICLTGRALPARWRRPLYRMLLVRANGPRYPHSARRRREQFRAGRCGSYHTYATHYLLWIFPLPYLLPLPWSETMHLWPSRRSNQGSGTTTAIASRQRASVLPCKPTSEGRLRGTQTKWYVVQLLSSTVRTSNIRGWHHGWQHSKLPRLLMHTTHGRGQEGQWAGSACKHASTK
mmetsp:Transcript_74771/g.109664  ORF Transcript_74771/g.109664 Transcript_74771/m.109664 type:complete len:203 (-) Transcript_74771:388-996(-)